MLEIIEKYGVVTLADMYELCDIAVNYTDHKYGWTNLRNAKIVKGENGYTIELPRVLAL